jgi:hypothetical protein
MKVVKDVFTVVPAVALTAATVLAVGGCHGPFVVGAAVSPGDRTTLGGVRRATRRWANGEAVRCWLWNRLQRLPDVAELT